MEKAERCVWHRTVACPRCGSEELSDLTDRWKDDENTYRRCRKCSQLIAVPRMVML